MSRDAIGRLNDALSRFGRIGLCTLPTPLEPMTRLSQHLAGPRLWVKREDCSGPGFGGNKLRKLDYVLHEALRAGVDTLVSGGVVQSNSQRQVAAAAAKLGLDPLGAVAYASTVAEIAQQCAALGFVPGAITHCSGSAGTQAGLVVGARVCLPTTRIVGIDIDAEPERVRADVATYGRAAADLLDQPFDEAAVEVVAGHAGPAYGVPHEATIEAIRLAAQLEALVLDPVYSGKGLAGLIALIRAGRWSTDDDVVFLHTGGAPALFAYRHLFDPE